MVICLAVHRWPYIYGRVFDCSVWEGNDNDWNPKLKGTKRSLGHDITPSGTKTFITLSANDIDNKFN